MPLIVTHGSVCKCSFGTAPCNLVVLPDKKVNINGLPAATIMDHKSGTNLATFTLCTTPVNPAVAANNNAPAPCVPVLPSPWMPGDPNMTLTDPLDQVWPDSVRNIEGEGDGHE